MEIKRTKTRATFGEAEKGVVFEYEDELYMKVDLLYGDSDMPNAVGLASGFTYKFANDLEIKIKDATLIVKE